MKRKVILSSLFFGCAGLMSAQTVNVDSLSQVVDSAIVVKADTAAVADVVEVDALSDSIAIALRPLTQISVDSTKLVFDQVKALTDKISEQTFLNAQLVQEVFSDTAIVNKYNRMLDEMVVKYAAEVENIGSDDENHVNPLYFRLFAPLTLYKSSVTQAMAVDATPAETLEDSLRLVAMASGKDVRLLNELDRVLLSTYLASPTLVQLTEDELKASQNYLEETKKNVSESAKLDVPAAVVATIKEVQPQAVTELVVQKPNFWVTKGSFSTQLTESYFSPNWYQGGINNINVLSMLTLEANYNNKRKVQWDNKLDARLGFYQNQGESIESNQDLLRLTSKLNLKAIRNWNYAIEAQGNTQILNHRDADKVLQSGFLSPADLSFTVGMDFKKSFDKGSISIFPGPLSYKLNYVLVGDLATNYGIEEGKHARHDVGSKIQVDFDYKITDNISYKTRFYYFTSYKNVQADWENTLNFQVSKYISTKLFFHTRFDDFIAPYKGWGHLQFKQYLMLGLNYAW